MIISSKRWRHRASLLWKSEPVDDKETKALPTLPNIVCLMAAVQCICWVSWPNHFLSPTTKKSWKHRHNCWHNLRRRLLTSGFVALRACNMEKSPIHFHHRVSISSKLGANYMDWIGDYFFIFYPTPHEWQMMRICGSVLTTYELCDAFWNPGTPTPHPQNYTSHLQYEASELVNRNISF